MAAIVPLSRRPYDWLFLAYFIVHIPITIMCDSQILLPASYFPQFLLDAMAMWIRDYDDVLSGTKPLWFQSFVLVELVFHVPFFFIAARAFYKGTDSIRTLAIVYAVETASSMIAIMPEAWDRSSAPLNTKLSLMAVYGLWCVLPLMLLQRVWNERVFTYAETKAVGKAAKKQK